MTNDLPTGTLTFLFTDVVGSTRLWEHHPDTMRAALIRHDAVIEQLVTNNDGQLVRPRGEGDSRFAVFPIASQAVTAAAAIQQALHAEPWPEAVKLSIRIALHTGAADLREGDYYGSTVNRCARLRGLAHGGQTLLSLATTELARDTLPISMQLRELGSYRLRDLTRPEQVFQLQVSGLPNDFPPLVGLGDQRTNLPIQPTALIGREAEIAEVLILLRQATGRLVTLTGPGGIGKTRLALQVAAELIDDYPDGVWFVDLAPLREAGQITSAIAQVLGIVELPSRSLEDSLRDFLRGHQLLLILDNFEHILSAAVFVSEFLRSAPGLAALITSRAPLQIRAEQEYLVPPLSLPAIQTAVHVQYLTQYEAVRLFITRAQSVQPTFSITNENAPAVAEICVRLDGLPLAIELAAARVRMFSPEQLLIRLGAARLHMLTSNARDLPDRHQTLRRTIEWSLSLLQPEEELLFIRLGVFTGGWSLETLEILDDEVPERDTQANLNQNRERIVDALESLVQHSLVRIDTTPAVSRYFMLETMRAYALEWLIKRDEYVLLHGRHAQYFAAFVEAAEPKLRSSEQLVWLDRIDSDYENIRSAITWALDRSTAHLFTRELGLRIVGSLWYYCLIRARTSDILIWLDHAAIDDSAVYNWPIKLDHV